MLLIPELKKIVLLVPRTGSGALRRAIMARYPKAILLYRHMEADGVPHGYDRWGKIGVVRNPLDRLWSLHKFIRQLDPTTAAHPIWAKTQLDSGKPDFYDWLIGNSIPFTNQYHSKYDSEVYAEFTILHSLPETRKSQFMYLRPDLGTELVLYERLWLLERMLDIELPKEINASGNTPCPYVPQNCQEHMKRYFDWEYNKFGWSI